MLAALIAFEGHVCRHFPQKSPHMRPKLVLWKHSQRRGVASGPGLPAQRTYQGLLLYGVAPAKSLAMVEVIPRTTVGLVVIIPTLRSSLVIAVVKLLLPS